MAALAATEAAPAAFLQPAPAPLGPKAPPVPELYPGAAAQQQPAVDASAAASSSGMAAAAAAAAAVGALAGASGMHRRGTRQALRAARGVAAQRHAPVALAAAGTGGPQPQLRRGYGVSVPSAAAPAAATTSTARQVVATEVATKTTFEVGQKLHGWTCARSEEITEFGCTGYLFTHDKTGAELISMVQPADENKTFSVVFRTPPENSNGIAHVLEHSVLCGSRKYPIKEPFVELMKSSLQTFLNAMTFPDRTCYPVASCNLKDFYNLIDVYLDAVFHPRAVKDPKVLAQEGWHYEIEKKEDPLTYKGVVYNEMKGVYSSPDSAHGRLANQSLFPDNAYGVDSGGDPTVIPSLTFDYFKDFHSKYYHPSNAKFWFYGDDPAEARLELLDKFLSEFEKIEVSSDIKPQPLFAEPRSVVGEFAVGEDEDISKKTMASIHWVLDAGKPDLQTTLALGFLNYLLMGTAASPLYKALVDSSLGSRVIGGGLYDGLLQPTFGVGLKDLKAEDVPQVEDLVIKTLQDLADKGFEEDAVKAAINTIEFQNRELNTGRFPKGLALLFAANDNWNYGNDPFEPLRFDAPLAALKERLAKGERVFEDLIKERLLNNKHKVVVESRPSKDLGKKVDEAEKAELAAHRETLSESDIDKLIEETQTLKKIQETPDSPEATKSVPRLELSDIPKETPKIPTEVRGASPTTLVHELPTSGVVYTDLAFNLAYVPEDLQPLVPIFSAALKQLGTAKGDFVSLTRRIGMSTGGITASTTCMNKIGEETPVAYLIVRGKAMAGQVGELVDLLEEITQMVNFDNEERLVQLVRQARSGAQSGIISGGHVVASGQLAAQTTKAGYLNSLWGGLSQYDYLTKLLEEIEGGGWKAVLEKLKALQGYIFTNAACEVLNITCDPQNVGGAQASLEAFAAKLPAGAGGAAAPLSANLGVRKEAIVVPTQVNYVGKGGNLYTSGYEFHGSSLVISKHLGATYLWDRVRVSGGAYGGFCRFDPRSGDFRYLSYRDPNLGKTIQAYDGADDFLKSIELGEDELSKAIIGCMGDVDSYMLPDAKGYQAMLRHLLGEGDEYRQKIRDEILGTTQEDFHRFAESLGSVKASGGICVVGSKEAVDAVQEEYGFTVSSPFAAAAPAAGGAA